MTTRRQNLQKNIQKSNFSEAVWGIKLKLCRIVSNMSLYRILILFFIAIAQALWLLWQLKVSIDLKIEIYCYLLAGVLTNVLQKCLLLSGPPPSLSF